MSNYFFGDHPNSKGGHIWTKIRLLHNVDIDNILADTREYFIKNKGHMAKQPIQHWDFVSIEFLKNIHPDVDVVNLNQYLCDTLTCMNRKVPLKLGLKVRTLLDGKKCEKKVETTHFRNCIQAVHCECEGAQKSVTVRLLKITLSSPSVQLRYQCNTRLAPNFDYNSGPYIQGIIARCIV